MRTTIFFFCVALLVVGVSPAMAAPGDVSATQDARASFRRGVQLYNEGSFEAALAEFNKAYQLSPNYRLLYNIAQTEFDLHDYVGASKHLEQYMKEGSTEISDERRTQVNELGRKLEERIGHVEVACNLDGAEIRIDDIPVGISPMRAAVAVNAGPRRFSAIKSGHPTAVRSVTIAGTEKKRVILEIEQAKRVPAAGAAGLGREQDLDIDAQPGKKKASSRVGLITSAVVTGACAVAAGTFGIMALQAKNKFDRDLKKVPGDSEKIDDDRSKMKSYALATDILAGATLLSAGAMVYFLLTDNTESASPKRSVAVAPTLGGLVLQGEW